MDARAVAGWDYDYDYDQEGVFAIGFNGKGQRTQRRKRQRSTLKLLINRAFIARVPPTIQVQRRMQMIPRSMLQLRRSWTSSPRVPQEQRR